MRLSTRCRNMSFVRLFKRTTTEPVLAPPYLSQITGEGDEDKYLIATSEQPLSGMFMDEWFEAPKTDLPIR